MDDLVKLLRKGVDRPATWATCDVADEIMDEAADRIEALERQVKAADALAEALWVLEKRASPR